MTGDATPGPRAFETALDQFLTDKGKGENRESGNYRRNAERVIKGFFEYLAEEDFNPPEGFDDLEASHFRRFIRHLLTVRDEDLASSQYFSASPSDATIRTYYAYVQAWCGWCSREEQFPLTSNVANTSKAKEPLPTADDDAEVRPDTHQSWTDDDRSIITSYVDREVDRALDDVADSESSREVAIKELRDRAFVYLIAYSGVRGAEVLRDPQDDRRNGLRWSEVDLNQQRIWVLGKRGGGSERRLTPKPLGPFERLRDHMDPASDDWPVFPTLHWPTLYDGLRDAGATESELDAADGRADVVALYRKYDAVPQSMTTDAGRRLMKRLCENLNADEEFGYELDFSDRPGEYLEPHGARRGVGAVLYKTRGAEQAAKQLDNSVEMVEESYSHLKTRERSEDVGAAFDEHDDAT